MLEELTDRFGDAPKAVLSLMEVAKLKACAHALYITEISGNHLRLKLEMYEKANIVVENIPKLVNQYQGALKFQTAGTPHFIYERNNNKNKEVSVLKILADLLTDMKILMDKEG